MSDLPYRPILTHVDIDSVLLEVHGRHVSLLQDTVVLG